MKTFGLIGYPLEHSFSQHYFTEKFKRENIEARYLNFAIPAINELPELLAHHPYMAGLNVTIPYKQQVIDYLDAVDSTAGAIGAVNVIKIIREDKKLHLKGYNSDVVGFTRSLTPLITPEHKKALILGTGGASRAVAHALREMGILFRFVSRSPALPSQVSYQSLTPEIVSHYKLIINTTPLGMYPQNQSCPDIPYEGITTQHLAYDLVYNPDSTWFMQNCARKGAVVKNGLEMLHLQAEAAWEIWNEMED